MLPRVDPSRESATVKTASERLNVLFVTNMYPDADNPASGTFVMHQVRQLQRAGHHVDVLHVHGNESRLKYVTSAFDVFNRTRQIAYDVVHAHYGLSGVPALFRFRVPLVITVHGSDALSGYLQPFITKTVCSLADAVIVVSKAIARWIPGEVIPCGVDLEMFTPRERAGARARLGLAPNRRVILFPFDPARRVKRFGLARAAVDQMSGLDADLVTVRSVRNEDMPWYYSAADAMILCSQSEGSPTAVKEALACNLPIVSTNVGDVTEILDGIEGCYICEATPSSLAAGLNRALSGDRLAFDGRSAMHKYDQQRTADRIVRVYQRVIQNRLAARATGEAGNKRFRSTASRP